MAAGMDSRPGTSQSGRKGQANDNLAAVANRLRTPMYVSERAMPPEEETIRSIESKLLIGSGSQSEEAFVMGCCGPDGLCIDHSFPPGPSSLYTDPAQLPASATGNIMWRRLSGALYMPSNKAPKLMQGSMQNGSFLGALAAVALRPGLLLDLIVSDDHAQQGAYTFQFYKHGCWHQITVDNHLPCLDDDPNEQRLAFACSSNAGELWPSLIEKAYAKVHGSYYALEGGSVGDILVDLTGGVVTKLRLDTEEGKELAQSGGLWEELSGSLQGGAVVVCSCKAREADAVEGPSGLLRDKFYSIMDARKLDKGQRLLRLHCPWSSGQWTGAWSNSSNEWTLPAARSHLDYFAPTLEDDATFWITYEDFISFFGSLHLCRLFPSSWHQLTLHCGWQGPSAGGPHLAKLGEQEGGEPIVGLSSTWCCNPQFRITVRKAADIVVCLGQRDPRVANRRHVRKQLRRHSIGMQVLKVPLASIGRRWEVKGSELAQEVALTVKREAYASFRADPDFAYIVVPYPGRCSEEGAFVIRAFSSSPLEIEQLPSPLSLVLGGHWVGHLAGGPTTAPTFGSNPQYMISCRQRTTVIVSAARLDVRYAVLKPEVSAEQCIGLMLLQPEKTPEGGLGRCTAVRDVAQVHGRYGFIGMEEVVALITLEPETPYVVVPCLAGAGLEAPFELRIMSSVPVELVPLPEVKCVVVQGEWGKDTSGGCDLNPVWRKNPRYLLVLSQPARPRVTLTRLVKGPKKTANVDDMIGFYILKATEPNGEIKGDLRRAVVFETTFVTTPENTGEKDLLANIAYILIPTTYSPGRMGRFTLGVTCNVDFDMVEL